MSKSKSSSEVKHWLVTVQGYNRDYSPSVETTTLGIVLYKNKTPVDWFLNINKPEVWSRFSFNPKVLINFWEITEEQYDSFYSDDEGEEDTEVD